MIKIDHIEYVELPVLKNPHFGDARAAKFMSSFDRNLTATSGRLWEGKFGFFEECPKTLPGELSALLRLRMRASSASAQSW